MRHSYTVTTRLFQIIAGVIIMGAPLLLCVGHAEAGDREEAKALVGKWKYQGIFGDDFELKADGKKHINGAKLDWTVKNGKLVFYNIFNKPTEYDYTLSPDGNTLKYDDKAYKRQ